MSENFQNSSLLGTANSLQLSLPVVSNEASLTGSVRNFSRVSTPAVSSSWILPSPTSSSFQSLMGSAYLYQHSSTTMLSGVTGQSPVSISTASYPSVFDWDMTGSTEKSSSQGDLTVTLIDQDRTISSMSMTAHYDQASDTNTMVPLYPSLSASLVQGTSSQISNQEHSLSLPYQEGSKVYYYNQSTLGPLLSGELNPCLQSYGSMSYTGSMSSASQPEMVMVLKEVQPTDVLPVTSTPRIYYSVSAQPITETSFEVMETSLGMDTSLGLQTPAQTLCLTQTPEFSKSCRRRNIQLIESNPPSDFGDISIIASVQSPSDFLALPPASTQEQKENKNLDETTTKLSKSLDAYQIPIENQDPPLLPLEIPDIHQLLASIDPLGQEVQPGSKTVSLGNSSLSLEHQGTIESEIESGSSFSDISTLVKDIHLPELFNSLKDLDQSKDLTAIKAKDMRAKMVNQSQEKSSVIKGPSDQVRKNKHKASEPISGAPKAKIQPKNQECLIGEEVIVLSAVGKHSNSKPQKVASSRSSNTKGHGQEKTKRTRGNNSKKAEEGKQSGNKVEAEEKPTIPKMKRKKNQLELSPQNFKKPRSCLGMHMLESVQVFHALGKKSDKKTGLSSSWKLGNSSNSKDPRLSQTFKPWLDTQCEGKGSEKTQVKAQKTDGSAGKECPSPSQYELPPPGKVKLIPLSFPTLDKPPARPIPRRPHSLASRRPASANTAQPGSTNSAQPIAVNPSQPAPANAFSTGPVRPAQPISTNAARPSFTNPTQPSEPQSAPSKPAPCKTSSCTSVQQEPVFTAVTKAKSPPKPQNQFPLQDFSCQPIPWRKPNISGPVLSKPITKEQRPEREAMKRKAQQERENAAKYSSLGKVQFFIEREKEMEISRYYGYVK
uniref:Chromosome 2 open reading frame 78 n=2 Tax=Propithecus coquereli TaxID=379532 RepID=A0A2K6GGJ1_PROCO